MSTRVLNLDVHLASRLASTAARNHMALPEWAVEQLGRLSGEAQETATDSSARDRMQPALGELPGISGDRSTTDDLMQPTRGEDCVTAVTLICP